jgi:hypothetical protein
MKANSGSRFIPTQTQGQSRRIGFVLQASFAIAISDVWRNQLGKDWTQSEYF